MSTHDPERPKRTTYSWTKVERERQWVMHIRGITREEHPPRHFSLFVVRRLCSAYRVLITKIDELLAENADLQSRIDAYEHEGRASNGHQQADR